MKNHDDDYGRDVGVNDSLLHALNAYTHVVTRGYTARALFTRRSRARLGNARQLSASKRKGVQAENKRPYFCRRSRRDDLDASPSVGLPPFYTMTLVGDKMFPGSLFGMEMFTGSIESMIAYSGFSGRFLEVLGSLPPEILVLLDTAHIWGPFAALIGFLAFGPWALAGGSNRFTRHAGLGGLGFLGTIGTVSNRAWFAFSTAMTIRQIVLWFVNLTPVKGALLSVGIEIIPARSIRGSGSGSRLAFESASDTSSPRSSEDSQRGTAERPNSHRKICFASGFEHLTNVPTTINPNRAPDVVSTNDYVEFKERMCDMPNRLPTLETNGMWTEMMHKSDGSGMHYKAWRHVLPYGGTEYLSRTMFENATVEEMVDFFGCDDTRASWDRLLFRHRVLERDEKTGAEVVFWERALPVISNRDYVFSRRTFKDADDTYWAITKGCRHVNTPESPGLKRVDPYFSSWRMRAVIGADGRLSASECILSHFEEQHVNQDVARFAVKCGMWGVVKNMSGGFRKFQRDRAARHAAAERGRADRAQMEASGVSDGVGAGASSETTQTLSLPGLRLRRAASASGRPPIVAVPTAPSKTKKRIGGLVKFLARSLVVTASLGTLAALEHRSRSLSSEKSSLLRRRRNIPRRKGNRGKGVGADDVEAVVRKVLDETERNSTAVDSGDGSGLVAHRVGVDIILKQT